MTRVVDDGPDDDRQPPRREPPRLGLMSLPSLLLFVLVGALLGAVVVSLFGLLEASLPVTPWTMSLMLALIGAACVVRARGLRRQLSDPETRPGAEASVFAFAFARTATLIGLLLAGAHLSYVGWQLGRLDVELYRDRAIFGAVAVLGSLVMALGAQVLERACKVPDAPEDEPQS